MAIETSLDLEDVEAFDYEHEEDSEASNTSILSGLGDIGGFIESNSSLLFFFLILVIIFNGSGTFTESNESLLFFFLILVILYNQFN